MNPPIVFDVDGTLTSERYDESNLLTLRENPIMMLLAISLQDKHPLLISTARPEYLRPQTEAWLAKHGLVPEKIYMRPNDQEGVEDHKIKEGHLGDIILSYGRPMVWADDNDNNCKMLEKHEVPVIHVKQ
jgi:hypothetical protein